MSRVSARPAATRHDWPSLRLAGGLLASLLIWAVADLVQAHLAQPNLMWAVLDLIGHAAVAVYVALWVWPIWGWSIVVAAGCAAVLIDLDHAVVAGSLLPDQLMGIGARPWPHSLLGVLLGTGAAWRLGGGSLSYGVGVGLFTHVLGDATSWPGVPLLVPLDPNPHVLAPAWTLPVIMAGLSAVGAALSSRAIVSTD